MKWRAAVAIGLTALVLQSCATARKPVEPRPGDRLAGLASWYGQEFAGRITANGEIYDPSGISAAHRTLPFGSIVRVVNPATGRSVEVRINDRGPFIGDRVIDLSYGAAEKIGMIDAGVARVDMMIVKIGLGEREPPVPFIVELADPPPSIPVVAAQAVPTERPRTVETIPVVVDRIDVYEERDGQLTRREVAEDGVTLRQVPVTPPPIRPAMTARSTAAAPVVPQKPPAASANGFAVQIGAFRSEKNANALRDRVKSIVNAYVDKSEEGLFRVRAGPFGSRDDAMAARTKLERAGLSGWIAEEGE